MWMNNWPGFEHFQAKRPREPALYCEVLATPTGQLIPVPPMPQ